MRMKRFSILGHKSTPLHQADNAESFRSLEISLNDHVKSPSGGQIGTWRQRFVVGASPGRCRLEYHIRRYEPQRRSSCRPNDFTDYLSRERRRENCAATVTPSLPT